MTDQERLQAITDRLDMILERVPDNPIYEDHEARAIDAYLKAIKTLREMEDRKHGVTSISDRA